MLSVERLNFRASMTVHQDIVNLIFTSHCSQIRFKWLFCHPWHNSKIHDGNLIAFLVFTESNEAGFSLPPHK